MLPSALRWLKGARDVAVCVVDIAVFKAATLYYVNEMPYRDHVGRLVHRYAERLRAGSACEQQRTCTRRV
jgi:hypothetical protein